MTRLKAILFTILALLVFAKFASAASFRTDQNALSTTAEIVGNTAGRVSILIQNHDTSINVFCGPTSGVTTSNGFRIAPGAAVRIGTMTDGAAVAGAPVYCISASGTPTVSFLESVK